MVTNALFPSPLLQANTKEITSKSCNGDVDRRAENPAKTTTHQHTWTNCNGDKHAYLDKKTRQQRQRERENTDKRLGRITDQKIREGETHTTNRRDNERKKCNIEARSLHHNCRGKAKSITYSECVLVASVIQHEMRMLQIVVCGLPVSNTCFHIISHTARFPKKKKEKRYSKKKSWYWILWINCVFSFSAQSFSETFLILGRTERDFIKKEHISLHLQCPLFCPI